MNEPTEASNLPPEIQEQLLALDELADEDIDLSDIPEITDWSGAVRGKFYRPVKQQITLRIDADVIAWFKAQTPQGRGYQTNINQALREHVQRSAQSAHYTTPVPSRSPLSPLAKSPKSSEPPPKFRRNLQRVHDLVPTHGSPCVLLQDPVMNVAVE